MNERLLSPAILAICILFGAFAQVLFKLGMSEIGGETLKELITGAVRSPHIIVGVILYGISFVLWLFAIRFLEVSFMYPLLSLAYIVVVFLSAVVLKENINTTRWIGVVLIVLGAILVGINK